MSHDKISNYPEGKTVECPRCGENRWREAEKFDGVICDNCGYDFEYEEYLLDVEGGEFGKDD